MPENTLAQAITELHSVVEALKELMEREYPRRDEIERTLEEQRQQAIDAFVTKKVSRQRWVIILALAPILVVSTFFLTITTISMCFLGSPGHPDICGIMPGYNKSIELRIEREKKQDRVYDMILRNDRRLARIEEDQ